MVIEFRLALVMGCIFGAFELLLEFLGSALLNDGFAAAKRKLRGDSNGDNGKDESPTQ